MIFVKLLALIVAGTILSKTYFDFKKKRETLSMFLFWTITWLAVAVFAIWPELYFKAEKFLGGFGLGAGTFLGLVFVFILFISYRVYVKAHRLERQLRDLVMKLGLKEIE